ncbi:hypothetical protein VTI74DRAFT_4749 [Chaetomium olivicolor]
MPSGPNRQIVAGMSATSPTGVGPLPAGLYAGSVSPRTVTAPAKSIEFRLLLAEPGCVARLPLRVDIYPHDCTESIISTARNFWGVYSTPSDRKGISFEDSNGNTLIARYENFHNNMEVFVRIIEQPLEPERLPGYSSPAPQAPQPLDNHVSHPPSAVASPVRSPSPNVDRGRRSASAGTNSVAAKKGRSRSSKNRTQVNGDGHGDSFNGYSSADGAPGSSSGRAKEQIGNTDISVENIVEGGRRRRAKFESSELPLFAPPQMPASTSNPSISPARRTNPHRHSLPYIQPGPNPFSNPRPLQSPQGYHNRYPHPGMYATPTSDHSRGRGSLGYSSGQRLGSTFPAMTPEPTVGTSVSDEDKDIAMQLMRLGEPPTQGRASASTLEDGFSGGADAASSAGATSDADSYSEDEQPAPRRQRLDMSGNQQQVFGATASHFMGLGASAEVSGDEADGSDDSENATMAAPTARNPKLKANTLHAAKGRQQPPKTKMPKVSKPKMKKATSTAGLMSPASLPVSRKQSVISNPAYPLAPGEEEQPDLSTKPRCQRCRKSKKGCDRQRPCGRCRDAGIPADQCISEDEGNGRKGRYGRHMGVPIRREDMPPPATNLLPAAPITADMPAFLAATNGMFDKNKKRKR